MFTKKQLNNRGFTLFEALVGAAVFLVISTAAYQAYSSLFKLISHNQYKVNALNLANEQFEIVRNMPYADVGVTGSIPNGKVPHIQNITRGNIPFVVTTTIRNVDLPFDGLIGETPNDLSPADNRLVEVEVSCPTCINFAPLTLTTTVAPKGLETASTNGALFIKVFDSNGIPIQGAQVTVANNKVNPPIVINDETDNNGMLQIVDAPPGNEAYEITVTKEGYSTDRTYQTGATGNPNPHKPHATVLLQQLTQISFSIDKLSTLSIRSVTPQCAMVGDMDFIMSGSKMIGDGIYKYSASLNTGISGEYLSDQVEWDSYRFVGIDTNYDIVGFNPLNPVNINPDSDQQMSLIVAPKNPRTIMVTVKDSNTLLPLTGANVRLSFGGIDDIKITGRGAIIQTDWSGGSGQEMFTDNTMYYAQDDKIDDDSPEGDIRLRDNGFGNYNSNGILESSIIDTGSASNFFNLVWTPVDQPFLSGSESVKLQFATNESLGTSTIWEYRGPDGATSTFYSIPNSTISSVHDGDRYARYRVYLSTESSTSTPNVSDVSFTMTTECTPPGQVVFSGLLDGSYNLEVSMAGYTTVMTNVNADELWKEVEILLTPS